MIDISIHICMNNSLAFQRTEKPKKENKNVKNMLTNIEWSVIVARIQIAFMKLNIEIPSAGGGPKRKGEKKKNFD